MAFQIVYKKRFQKKLNKLFAYIETEFGKIVADEFASKLNRRFSQLKLHPYTGRPSAFKNIRSIPAGRQNRIYYRIENQRLVMLNIFDNRSNPKRNKYK